MKKYLPSVLISFSLIIPSVFALADYRKPASENPVVFTDFRLEIIRDGIVCDENRLVHLEIWNLGKPHGYYALWTEVYVQPLHDSKKVHLAAVHYQSEHSIEHIDVGPKTFSFRINKFQGLGLTADIVGKRKEGKHDYFIEASALTPIRSAEGIKKVPERWQSTDKDIVLPYREVYFPTRASLGDF